jgi:hypothetical protein
MRIFKLVTTLLVLGLITLFFYQNTPAFQSLIQFQYDLKIKEQMMWSHHLYTLLLVSGAAGFVLGILVMMKPYFNVRRLLAKERQEKLTLASTQVETPPASPIEISPEEEKESKAEA